MAHVQEAATGLAEATTRKNGYKKRGRKKETEVAGRSHSTTLLLASAL